MRLHLSSFRAMEDHYILELFVCYTHHSNMTILWHKTLYTLDVHFSVVHTCTMTDIDRELEHCCMVLPHNGSMSPTGILRLSQVMMAQLFSSNESRRACVIVICLWSNTTIPISSMGRVVTDCCLIMSATSVAFSTSGIFITIYSIRSER